MVWDVNFMAKSDCGTFRGRGIRRENGLLTFRDRDLRHENRVQAVLDSDLGHGNRVPRVRGFNLITEKGFRALRDGVFSAENAILAPQEGQVAAFGPSPTPSARLP